MSSKKAKKRKLQRRRVKRALGRLLAADGAVSQSGAEKPVKPHKKRGAKRKYATEEEAKEAARQYQAAYRKARREGTWKRKNKVHSPRIAAKLNINLEADKEAKKKERLKRTRERELKRAEREAKREFIRQKYGFDPSTFNKEPQTPEAIEGHKQWLRDEEAAYREQHREHITIYNREYRKKRRAAALVEAQKSWTAAEWEEWKKKEDAKLNPPGTPQWLVRRVVEIIAKKENRQPEEVTASLIERDAISFLIAGAKSLGQKRASKKPMLLAAVAALRLYLDINAEG